MAIMSSLRITTKLMRSSAITSLLYNSIAIINDSSALMFRKNKIIAQLILGINVVMTKANFNLNLKLKCAI